MLFKGRNKPRLASSTKKEGNIIMLMTMTVLEKMYLLFNDATEAFQLRIILKRRSEVVNVEQESV
jgi:hypothetical protein